MLIYTLDKQKHFFGQIFDLAYKNCNLPVLKYALFESSS